MPEYSLKKRTYKTAQRRTAPWRKQKKRFKKINDGLDAYLSTLEHALFQMEKVSKIRSRSHSACTNEWCESVEEAINELTEAIYAFNIPRWANQEQSARVKTLKRKARVVYAKYMQASG